MSFNHHYQNELSALRQLGMRFAERNPALSAFLGEGARDPDVERLLEGFAFLSGRLRQKLDDELPELTHSLMHLLWPNYMRPLPAFGMLQFDPLQRPGNAQTVPLHTPVESRPIDGVSCRFRTAFTTEVQPLALRSLDYSVQGRGALLCLRLSMSSEGNLGELSLDRLRLHLAGERHIAQSLYLALLRHLGGVQVVLLDEQGNALCDSQAIPLAPLALSSPLQPVGFAEDEALVPYPLNTFSGYRHLQEYFAFQDKYLFVDVTGLGLLQRQPIDQLQRARGIELRLLIDKAPTHAIRPTLDNVRLYCTPVANLFAHDAVPIRLDGRQDQYLLIPAELDGQACGVYSVDRVTGWKPGGMGYETYLPFESFEHDHGNDSARGRPHYSVRQQPSLFGGLETWLSFGARDLLQPETLSIELTCSNQNLPQQLKPGDLCLPGEGMPEFLTFRNIGAMTSSYAPPLHRHYLWQLISNLSLNYLSLNNIEALRAILETYDLPRHYDQQALNVSQRRMAGLQHIRHRQVDRLYRGLPVRGVRTELSMNQDGFLGEGDLFLFASVLNEFFALYASLNSYHELRVTSTQGEVYRWMPRMGQQPLL